MSVHESKYKDKTMVTVKPLAYYKMLVHVLRFGNKVRDHRQYKEVMGILIGRLEGKDEGVKNVIVEDAVPISHGGSIEVAFKPEDYVSFSYVDAEYAERDPPLFSVGWYHSHPNLKIFYSATDIKNQLGWQVPNPSAIGIVFDHAYLETPGDMGFRTFRLDDAAKGPMADYHEVKTIVEPPDNTEYYIKIMEIINSIHSKEPPILEINETPDLFGDISMPGQNQLMFKQPEIDFGNILGSLQEGIAALIISSIKPIVSFFNAWSQRMVKEIIDNNMEMRKDLIGLRDNVSNGMNEIQSTFKSTLTNQLYDLDAYFDDLLEGFDKDQETIKTGIIGLKDTLSENINKMFEVNIKSTLDQLYNDLDKQKEEIQVCNEKAEIISNNLHTQQVTLTELPSKIISTKESIVKNLKESQEKMTGTLAGKVKDMAGEMSEISRKVNELATDLDTAISLLADSKKTIQDKLNAPKDGGVS